MPNPMLVLGVIKVGVDMVRGHQRSKAQNEQAKANQAASYKAGSLDLSTLQVQLQQLIQGNNVEVYDRQRQGAKDRAKILAAAGEANISGNSLMRLQAANMLDEARDKGIHRENLENQMNQGAMEAYKIKTDASTNANYYKSQRTNPFLDTLALGASKAAEGYQMYEYYNRG